MDEDLLLSKIRQWCKASAQKTTLVGIGDDAAVIAPTETANLFCSDFTIENTHFDLSFSKPFDVGFKSLARALSDIAAMGGRPLGVTVSMALPKKWSTETGSEFLEGFYQGAVDIASKTNTEILGGDLSSVDGPIVIDVAALGQTYPHRRYWPRSGAKPTDLAFVTGSLGAAGFALHEFKAGRTPPPEFAIRHLRPWPRLDIAKELNACPINAAMDLSDGLGKDALKMARESKVSFHFDETKIPLALKENSRLNPRERLDFAINSGDDYELLLAIPKEWATSSEGTRKLKTLGLTHIGHFS